MFAVVTDEEWSLVAGLPVRGLNALLVMLTAVAVVAAMQIVGILLVAALMVLPVASAQQLTRSFRATLVAAVGVGAGAAATVWGSPRGGPGGRGHDGPSSPRRPTSRSRSSRGSFAWRKSGRARCDRDRGRGRARRSRPRFSDRRPAVRAGNVAPRRGARGRPRRRRCPTSWPRAGRRCRTPRSIATWRCSSTPARCAASSRRGTSRRSNFSPESDRAPPSLDLFVVRARRGRHGAIASFETTMDRALDRVARRTGFATDQPSPRSR